MVSKFFIVIIQSTYAMDCLPVVYEPLGVPQQMGSESKKRKHKNTNFSRCFFTCLDLRENPNQGLKFYFCQIVTLLELGVPTFLLSVETGPLPKQRRKRTRRMVAVWFAVIIIVVLLGERLLTVDVAELLLVEVLTHDGSSFTFKAQK